jgi:Holliday junction DNA helicase RuvA
MGVRKAIKALTLPTGRVAAAIESGDAKALARLPGIGARVADQIVAELKGKVANFVIGAPDEGETPAPAPQWTNDQLDALEVMVTALGERRNEAQRWLERAMQLHPQAKGADEWVRLAYRIRSGAV